MRWCNVKVARLRTESGHRLSCQYAPARAPVLIRGVLLAALGPKVSAALAAQHAAAAVAKVAGAAPALHVVIVACTHRHNTSGVVQSLIQAHKCLPGGTDTSQRQPAPLQLLLAALPTHPYTHRACG